MSSVENALLLGNQPYASPLQDNLVTTVAIPLSNTKRWFLCGAIADFSATVAAAKAITIKKGIFTDFRAIDAVTLSRGGNFNVASTAFSYILNKTSYYKAAVAGGTALAAGTIPTNKWGIYRNVIDSAGTITSLPGAANFTTGYDSEALAIAALPALTANTADMGYTAVKTAVGQPFVGGTDALEGGTGGNVSSDTNYYGLAAPTLTTLTTLRWYFNPQASYYWPFWPPLHCEHGEGFVVTLEASGTGGVTGRLTLFAS